MRTVRFTRLFGFIFSPFWILDWGGGGQPLRGKPKTEIFQISLFLDHRRARGALEVGLQPPSCGAHYIVELGRNML
jgi:hypothetical protein